MVSVWLVWEWMMASMCVLNLVLSPLAVACTHPTCASSFTACGPFRLEIREVAKTAPLLRDDGGSGTR